MQYRCGRLGCVADSLTRIRYHSLFLKVIERSNCALLETSLLVVVIIIEHKLCPLQSWSVTCLKFSLRSIEYISYCFVSQFLYKSTWHPKSKHKTHIKPFHGTLDVATFLAPLSRRLLSSQFPVQRTRRHATCTPSPSPSRRDSRWKIVLL